MQGRTGCCISNTPTPYIHTVNSLNKSLIPLIIPLNLTFYIILYTISLRLCFAEQARVEAVGIMTIIILDVKVRESADSNVFF